MSSKRRLTDGNPGKKTGKLYTRNLLCRTIWKLNRSRNNSSSIRAIVFYWGNLFRASYLARPHVNLFAIILPSRSSNSEKGNKRDVIGCRWLPTGSTLNQKRVSILAVFGYRLNPITRPCDQAIRHTRWNLCLCICYKPPPFGFFLRHGPHHFAQKSTSTYPRLKKVLQQPIWIRKRNVGAISPIASFLSCRPLR